MAFLTLDKATLAEREALAPIRADAWAKDLSKQEFCERNRILYAHPFGKNRIETFLLKNPEKKIVSSMDVLKVKLFFREDETCKTKISNGFLIASVVTPIQHRRKGYATYLIQEFLKNQKFDIGVLYSDIGPQFYERYDFRKTMVQAREMVEPFGESSIEPAILSAENWLSRLAEVRKERFETTKGAQVALFPDPEFWDWQLEKYRYFSKLRGDTQLPAPFFEIKTANGPSYFCVVKNCLTQTGDVLWFDYACPESLPAIGKVVRSWGLKKIQFWSPHNQGTVLHEENPMAWFRGATKLVSEGFYDPQLCDWW